MNNFKVTVDGTYTVNFMDQVLTVKVKDGVAISRESELEAKLELAIGQRNRYHSVAEMEGMANFTVEELDMQLEKLRGEE